MKRGHAATALLMAGTTLLLVGCGAGGGSPSTLASNEPMTISAANGRSSSPRGYMVAGDSLGRAVFSSDTPAMASVPDRD